MLSSPSQSSVLTLRQVALAVPWQAYLLPVSGFPVPEPELFELQRICEQLIGGLQASWALSSEVFLQLEQLRPAEARSIVSARAGEWVPEVGLGVWPDRQPPEIWTKEEIMNTGPGERLRPLMFQVFQITASLQAKTEARKTMFRFGSYMEILSPGGSSKFLAGSKAYFLNKIRDRSYRSFSFYVPLIEEKTLRAASAEDLQSWMSGAAVYVRQSFEDQAILILSSVPLPALFRDLQASGVQNPSL